MTLKDLIGTWYVKLIAIALLCVISFGAAWSWRGALESEHNLADLRASLDVTNAAARATAKIAEEYQNFRNENEKKGSDAQKEIQNEIDKNPVYRSCILPPASVRAINKLSGFLD